MSAQADYEVTVLAGRDIPDSKRKTMPEEDFAGKGRSYPIETPEDVHNAAQSIGRAGDDNYPTEELKANIIRIAKRKGAEFVAQLPEEWKSEKKLAAADVEPRLVILIGDSRAATDGMRRMPVALITRGFKGKQKFAVTRDDLKQIVANFRKRDADVVVDYEHSTLRADDGVPTPTAGWLKRVDDEPDAQGVLWGWVEYTQQGMASVQAKDYKYASPVIEWSRRDKKTGEQQGATVTSIALTKQPLFENLPELPLVACDGWEFDRGEPLAGRQENVVEDGRAKEAKQVKITKVMAGAAGKVRLVADDNTETEMQVEGLRVLSMADVKRGSDKRWDFASLPQGEGMLVASDVLRAMDVQAAIDAAVKDGKIMPAQREFYEKSAMGDFEGFKALAASMKPVVELRERGTGADGAAMNNLASVEAEIERLTGEKLAARKDLGHGQALKLVASENPALFRLRGQLLRAGGRR
jgi:phage I-like protein